MTWSSTHLPILTFHTIESGAEAICFPPQVFRRGLERLHASGYRSLSLSEVAGWLRTGGPPPGPALAITFDDGYQSLYDEAFPVLQRYGLTATIFLTVGEAAVPRPGQRLPSLSGRPMLSWGEIQEMRRAGITFGAHTLTHPDLTRLPADRVEVEVRDSKAVIEQALGEEIHCFAYPYGRYDAYSREIAQQLFDCACSDRLGLATAHSDPHALERVDAYYLRTDRLFALMTTGLFPWYIMARRVPRQIRRALSGGPE
jgi:peptidoglycan/xylan/chitin deacetylase (PgdA/CDA1 family)